MNRVTFSEPSYNYRELVKKDIKSVAKEFESILIKQVLKEAFRSVLKDKSIYQRFYHDMFLEGVSKKLAEAGGVGIAKFIVETYEKNAHQPKDKEELRLMVKRILKEEGLPGWLSAIPEIESSYEVKAVSSKGAAGMWQLMPETAKGLGLKVDKDIDERFDPLKSTRAAVRHLKSLYGKYKNWILVLIAYNWGEGNLDRLGAGKVLQDLNLLPEETRTYVDKLLKVIKLSAGK